MLEKMDDFFNSRLKGYEEHLLNEIASSKIFYPFTLPLEKNTTILDLGCGTGLELTYYFPMNPTSNVIGFDTLLTIQHEKEALIQGGFSFVEILNSFGATYILKAIK